MNCATLIGSSEAVNRGPPEAGVMGSLAAAGSQVNTGAQNCSQGNKNSDTSENPRNHNQNAMINAVCLPMN